MKTITRQNRPFESRTHAVYKVRHPLVNLTLHALIDASGSLKLVGISFMCQPGPNPITNSKLARYEVLLRRFLDGKEETLPIPIDISTLSPFARDVLEALMNIRWGSTVSYRQLARLSGHPRAVRAASSVVARNPFPLIIPCHRVIRSDGSIGGFMGKLSGRSIDLKRRLLENEGVMIK
jgi:methylated-DNA-[protein]-cysteine S-methyltransferase